MFRQLVRYAHWRDFVDIFIFFLNADDFIQRHHGAGRFRRYLGKVIFPPDAPPFSFDALHHFDEQMRFSFGTSLLSRWESPV